MVNSVCWCHAPDWLPTHGLARRHEWQEHLTPFPYQLPHRHRPNMPSTLLLGISCVASALVELLLHLPTQPSVGEMSSAATLSLQADSLPCDSKV